MITIIDLAAELGMTSSALRKSVIKMGITPFKAPRQTATGVQQLNCLTASEAARVRKHYGDARTLFFSERTTS